MGINTRSILHSLERLSTAFRQPDIIEFSFLDELCEGLDHFFDRDIWIHSRALEEVDLFGASEVFIDIINTPAEVFGPSVPWSDGQVDVDIGFGEPTMNQEQVHLRRDLPG